tara:strand:+ start:11408 stop:12514 length:1107 start_codon:yes stop_codon:yes gene_type:complete
MANYSFWEDALHSKKYDLVVVGAGITGQSTAYFYKKEFPDADVLVIDRGSFPIGASTRNAGFACIGTIGEHLADLEIEAEAAVKNRIKSRYNGLLLLRGILGDDAINYEHCGSWEVFDNKDEFKKCSTQIDKFNAWMEELLGENEMYSSGEYQGHPAIFNKVEGMLHPGKMMQRLHEMNVQSGVEFRWNSPVKRIDADLGRVFVEERSSFHTNKIVVATNAFSGALVGEHVIKPGRGYVFITKPLKNSPWKGTFHYNKGYVYFRNLGEDRLLLGGGRNVDITTEETTEFGVNESIKKYLVEFANTVIKLPKNWEIEREWSGIMGFTETKSPHIKQIGERGLLVAGLSGMGVALGMQLGKTAASKVTGF